MKSHVQSSCIELLTFIENGLRVVNPSNLTRREVVDSHLDATAKHMIQLGVGPKDMPQIQHLNTAQPKNVGTLSPTYLLEMRA